MGKDASTSAGTALTTTEQKRLDELEVVVASAINGFAEAGAALREIRDTKLYKAKHGTFEAYCVDVWGLSIAHGKRLMAAGSVQEVLAPIGAKVPTESIARELAPLASKPEELVGAWQRSVEEHGKPTAAQVREIVQASIAPPAPPPLEDVKPSEVELETPAEAPVAEAKASRVPAVIEGPSPKTRQSAKRAIRVMLDDGWSIDDVALITHEANEERSA